MYDHIREDTLFAMLYAVVTAMAMLASGYLLFRRANAIAPDITPPVRLRQWTAAFFAVLAVNHLWYMPIFFLSSSEDIMMTDLIGGMLDSMTLFPVAIIVLLTMLQDRKRPLWPVAAIMAPIIAAGAWSVATRSYALQPMVYVYTLLICMGLIIYMVRALRQYGRWLRDNYADLEHKEVWQSFVVLAIIMLVFAIYAFVGEGPVYQYALQVVVLVLVCYLIRRVETLQTLLLPEDFVRLGTKSPEMEGSDYVTVGEGLSSDDIVVEASAPPAFRRGVGGEADALIATALDKYCKETQFYLQHDLTLSQLAREIGTNRTYLTNYLIHQGTTYNAYINDLRIKHFVKLYREAVATQRAITAQQLAYDCGYRSYSTFSLAFKQLMGQTVRAWMCNPAE